MLGRSVVFLTLSTVCVSALEELDPRPRPPGSRPDPPKPAFRQVPPGSYPESIMHHTIFPDKLEEVATGGTDFNDGVFLDSSTRVQSLELRGGKRLDRITFNYSKGPAAQSHGGSGGKAPRILEMRQDEYIKLIWVCWGEARGSFRILYANATTNQDAKIAVGTPQPNGKCGKTQELDAPGLIGALGSAGDEIDRIGFFTNRPK